MGASLLAVAKYIYYCFNFSTIKSCGRVSKAFDKSIDTMPITL